MFPESLAPDADAAGAPNPTGTSGPPLSLRIVSSAIRRSRRIWVVAAVIGLLAGLVLAKERPEPATATTTLLLEHSGAPDASDAMTTDTAMLSTPPVAQAVVNKLHLHESALALLGQFSTVAPSNEVLQITLSAPTGAQALRRSDALAHAFLAFRAASYQSAAKVQIDTLNSQLNSLQSQVEQLTTEIDALPAAEAAAGTGDAAPLVSERTQDVTQESEIRATIQSDQLNAATNINTSGVLSPPVLNHRSRYRAYAVDGAVGLLAGLLAAMVAVGGWALVTDRVRRRDDAAAALRAPVVLSLPRWRPTRLLHQRRLRKRIARPDPVTDRLARHLRAELERSARVALVEVDGADAAATASVRCALDLATTGRRVMAVDLSAGRSLARLIGARHSGTHLAVLGQDTGGVWLSVQPGGAEAVPSRTDAVVVLATLDPAVGADHVATWADEALVVVTAGRSTFERLRAAADMLRLAGIAVTGAVLVGPDPDDESLGRTVPEPWVDEPGLAFVPSPVDVPRPS